VVVVHRGDASAAMPDRARRRATVRARGSGSGSRLGDRVTRRGVRDHVGQRADRDERAGGHPPVDPGEASDSDVARNLCSVAPHR
jgi:hypothetical protein